jgi:hypothetical protein
MAMRTPYSEHGRFQTSSGAAPEGIKVSTIRLPMQQAVALDPAETLTTRREQIRRRRRPQARGVAVNAAWGVVFLLCGWLLFSGIFGLPGA